MLQEFQKLLKKKKRLDKFQINKINKIEVHGESRLRHHWQLGFVQKNLPSL